MRVEIYEDYEHLYEGIAPIEINGVIDTHESHAGGWLIATDNKNYAFPASVCVVIYEENNND